jgi:hypothetical protein
MSLLCLRSLVALAILVGALGCGSKSAAPVDASRPFADGPARSPDSRPVASADARTADALADARHFDGSADSSTICCPTIDPPGFDAAACDCPISADGVVQMSWACYCHYYGCSHESIGDFCDPSFVSGTWTRGCGLVGFTFAKQSGQAGQSTLFFDPISGLPVGLSGSRGDAGTTTPPTDGPNSCVPGTYNAASEEVGQVRSPTCASIVNCTCDDVQGVICPVDGSILL